MLSSMNILALSLAATCAFVLRWLHYRASLPPGPRGFPIIGNLFSHPKSYEWIHWAKYKEKYGPVSSVVILGQPVIILNTLEACEDLLEKRSAIYSGRPVLPFAGELIGWNRQMILCQYNNQFRTMRKMVHSFIGTKAAIVPFRQVQELELKYFLSRVNANPDKLIQNIRLTAGAIFLKLSHGYPVKTEGTDPLVHLVETAAKEFYVATTPGLWLVDTFPFLQHLPDWLPGTDFKRVAKLFRKTNMEQVLRPHEFVQKQLREGVAPPSFTSIMLQKRLDPQEDDAVKWAANSLYGGGTDTVAATMSTFFLAMVLYPEVQHKAQEEIDQVIGTHRLPNFDDRERLPYLAAVQKEVLRWHTIGPMGIPHCATADDVYHGYFIPKGSIVLCNLWEIARDPAHYTDPTAFNPDRFYHGDDGGQEPQLDPHAFVFGFGRRRCPGLELADATVFISMAMSLAAFDMCTATDEREREVVPRVEFISGTVSHPKPFPYTLKPRSIDGSLLIRSVQYEETGPIS